MQGWFALAFDLLQKRQRRYNRVARRGLLKGDGLEEGGQKAPDCLIVVA